jgi:phage terminase large subunit-like protein
VKEYKLKMGNRFKALDRAFHSQTKYVTIHAGRRTGKTYNAVQWLYYDLFRQPLSALWVDTVHRNIDKYIERYFQPIAGPVWEVMRWEPKHKVLKFPNNSYIDFGSAERPELLEGFQYDRMLVNESGLAFKKAGLWDNVLAPMTKGDTSKTRFVGTPKGRNTFFTLASYGISKRPGWWDYHFTAFDSPYWSRTELQTIQKRVPEIVWKQEYLAQFIEGEGSVFRNLTRCYSTERLMKGVAGRRYVMAVDLAKHQDFTVIMVADTKTRTVVQMDRFNQIDWVIQKRRIAELFHLFNEPKLVIDSTGIGDTILDDLRQVGMRPEGVRFTSEIKRELIQDLTVGIDSERIYFFPFPELVNELEIFEYSVSAQGNVSYAAPEGFHDDTVVTLAMVLYGLDKYKNKGEAVGTTRTLSDQELMRKTYEVTDDTMPNVYAELIKRQLRRSS